MKKKILLLFVALISLMLCACGSSESNNNSESEMKKEFSVVGEWKILSIGSSFIFNEDGTFESEYYGGGYKYEYTLGADVIKMDLDGLGLMGLGMQELDVVYEDEAYKIQKNNICLVPASEHERLYKDYQEQVAASESEEQEKKETFPIEGIYLISKEKDFPYGYYFDGKDRYTKVDSEGVSYGSYHISASTEDGSKTAYVITLGPDVTGGSSFSYTKQFYVASDGSITSFEWVTNTEKKEFSLEQVDESTFFNYFK